MKALYRIKTVGREHDSFSDYTVLATTAEKAIKKVKPKLDKDNEEQVEEIEVLGVIEIE